MRRKDREITDPKKVRQIILASHCCRLGFCDQGQAYIVPLNFGYEEVDGKRLFYFHSARQGRKLDLIGGGTAVGFELDTHFTLRPAQDACKFSASFQSVIGTGWAVILEEERQKLHALQCIMGHLSGKTDWDISQEMLHSVAIIRMEVESLSCKEHL